MAMDVTVVENDGLVMVLSDDGIEFEQELPRLSVEVTCVTRILVPENNIPYVAARELFCEIPTDVADSFFVAEMEATVEIRKEVECYYGKVDEAEGEVAAAVEDALECAGYEVLHMDVASIIDEYEITPAVLLYDATKEFSSALLYRDDDGHRIVGFGTREPDGDIDVFTEVTID